nr:arylsulfatase-like isoform X2 [Lytechinus pictus]
MIWGRYGDLESYGHPSQESGPIDQMAREGMKFSRWYSPDILCSPSRGAMLTGRLPVRVGLYGPARVFEMSTSYGLPKSETTIAEMLREQGYHTGMVGKWHQGMWNI